MLASKLGGRKHLEILDVGTGPGQLALMFAEMGHHLTAVDLSASMLEKPGKMPYRDLLILILFRETQKICSFLTHISMLCPANSSSGHFLTRKGSPGMEESVEERRHDNCY